MMTSNGRPSREARRAGTWKLAALVFVGVLGAAIVATPQEIIQAHVLDLTVLEVQVIVTGAVGTDQVQCLLRDGRGQVRMAGSQKVSSGAASGRTTVVSVPLSLPMREEREFSVTLVRGDRELDRTPWRPLAPRA